MRPPVVAGGGGGGGGGGAATVGVEVFAVGGVFTLTRGPALGSALADALAPYNTINTTGRF